MQAMLAHLAKAWDILANYTAGKKSDFIANEVWASDITSFKVNNYYIYTCVIKVHFAFLNQFVIDYYFMCVILKKQ